jgi:hypothetical protein
MVRVAKMAAEGPTFIAVTILLTTTRRGVRSGGPVTRGLEACHPGLSGLMDIQPARN